MILLVDNYDSFTFNLYQALAELGADVAVTRNDAVDVEGFAAAPPEAVVLSPGPGRPEGAGACLDLLAALPLEVPVLGVCLGHQAIVVHHGGALEVDAAPAHGKASAVAHDGRAPFDGLPSPLTCGRYHSLRADRAALPDELEVCAWTADGAVMAVRHRAAPRVGVQFHPESILTPDGPRLLASFLASAGVATHAIR